jgi:anti-anti-sigma factor
MFREEVEKAASTGLDLMLDLSGVHYINSTGLGHILSLKDELQIKECNLVLVGVRPEVMSLVEMLGLHNVLPVRDNTDEALLAIDEGPMLNLDMEKETSGKSGGRGAVAGRVLVPVNPPDPLLPEAKIILGFNGTNHLTKLISRCFTGDEERALIASSKKEFAEILGKSRIDVAVIDSELSDFNEIVSLLKTDIENGLVSIISVYSSGNEREKSHSFRFIEDEFVVEPFDVREIMATIEREYNRCRDEGTLFKQEAEFDFEGQDDQIDQAAETLTNMLSGVNMDAVARDSFVYAVREAIDNARKHGNKLLKEKHIDLLYILDQEKITITIQDEGEGFDYKSVVSAATNFSPIERARQNHQKGKQGGLGISLMLRCCDKVEFIDPGNLIKLTKYL